MKKTTLALAICVLTSIAYSPSAEAEETYGHWAARDVKQTGLHQYQVNSFKFSVKDKKIEKFIHCSKKHYSDKHIFLLGDNEVVTTAYVCFGEINLSNCSGERRKSCPK